MLLSCRLTLSLKKIGPSDELCLRTGKAVAEDSSFPKLHIQSPWVSGSSLVAGRTCVLPSHSISPTITEGRTHTHTHTWTRTRLHFSVLSSEEWLKHCCIHFHSSVFGFIPVSHPYVLLLYFLVAPEDNEKSAYLRAHWLFLLANWFKQLHVFHSWIFSLFSLYWESCFKNLQ